MGEVWTFESPIYDPPHHQHEEIEVNLITKGRGRYLVDNETIEVHAGCLFALFPNQWRCLIEHDESFHFEIAAIEL